MERLRAQREKLLEPFDDEDFESISQVQEYIEAKKQRLKVLQNKLQTGRYESKIRRWGEDLDIDDKRIRDQIRDDIVEHGVTIPFSSEVTGQATVRIRIPGR